MTEDGHGSDVQHLRTTATYDADAGEFVIDTPDDDAHKMWIGNAARDGRMAAVFAQLIVGGEKRGVHALLVPLRDDDGTVLDGRPDRGLRPQARPRRRRQRQALVRRRARPARGAAGPLREGLGERHVLLGDREPDQALLLDARDADPGPRERRRRGHQRVEGRARDRRPPRGRAAPVRPAGRRGGDADDLPHPPAPPAPAPRRRLRAALRAGAPGGDPGRALRRGGRARPRARDDGGRAEGRRHLARDGDDPGLPRGLRRPGLPAREPLRRPEGRHRRLHHLRGRQHRAVAARGQEPAHRLQAGLRGARHARHGVVLRRPAVRAHRRALGAARADRAGSATT